MNQRLRYLLLKTSKKKILQRAYIQNLSLRWFDAHGGVSTWNTVEFDEVILSEEASDSALFTKPDTSKIVE